MVQLTMTGSLNGFVCHLCCWLALLFEQWSTTYPCAHGSCSWCLLNAAARLMQVIDGYDHFGAKSCALFDEAEIARWNAMQNVGERYWEVRGLVTCLVTLSCSFCLHSTAERLSAGVSCGQHAGLLLLEVCASAAHHISQQRHQTFGWQRIAS